MSSSAISTVVQIIEDLPEAAQQQAIDHLREYLDDLRDELQWDAAFAKTQPRLAAAARRAKREIAEGMASPLDIDRL